MALLRRTCWHAVLVFVVICQISAPAMVEARRPSYYYMTRHSLGPRFGSHYTNVDGESVHSPMRDNGRPAGASAQCGDGTWSFSQHARGTCSHHRGAAGY
ncbi:DUF3761 domain-containing protein [Novosphingobium sp.]|uniref:DUF3761 domain-containing protein n=1 Tax=Novosphingobium sp. TaxID=1874826 RepID=UPI003D104BEC